MLGIKCGFCPGGGFFYNEKADPHHETVKKILLTLAALLSLSTVATAAGDEGNYVVTKISNPDRGEGEVDGLMPGGFRENSYTWRLAERGVEIFIATSRNLANGVVNMFTPVLTQYNISTDTFWSIVDAVTNGDIPHNSATPNEGANIISYNRKTDEYKVLYTAERTIYFRMAVTFGEDVYFGTYSAYPNMPQYLLKLDKQGNFTKVFETSGSVSLRANCVYDNHLFFAGADAREEVDPNDPRTPCKIAVLRKSNADDTKWTRVADYKDFGEYAYDPMMFNTTGCPVWELAVHNDYIYASGPSTEGMIIFRGHPAAAGETPNEYGWYWEEVVGLNNGINNPGLSDIVGGEPDTYRSVLGSVFEFNGELYSYTFDHTVGGMQTAITGMLNQIAGQPVKASEYLRYIYSTLQHPQKIWKLNDATGKFEECVNFTKLTEGTTNEYIWRMGIYDGQLYISTMDSGVCYGYLTQLTNGSFFSMTPDERAQKIEYIQKVIDILTRYQNNKSIAELIAQLEEMKDFLEQFKEDEQIDEQTLAILEQYQEMIDQLLKLLEDYINGGNSAEVQALAQAMIGGDSEAIAYANALAALAQLPDDYFTNAASRAKRLIAQNGYDAVEAQMIGSIEDALQALYDYLKNSLEEIADRIDVKGIQMYAYINKMVREDEWGFDLFRTSDGVDFEVITRTGFDDKYNYGCPSFLATEEGMYIGTCNPFYGGQLHLLTNLKEPEVGVSTIAADSKQLSDVYYTPSGLRIVGTPTEPGIYINDGRKVIVRP